MLSISDSIMNKLGPKQDSLDDAKKSRISSLKSTLDKQKELPYLIIIKSCISVLSWEEMKKMAGPIRITNTLFSGIGSVNDPRMGGVSDRLPVECTHCNQIDCPGHYGIIEFGKPIYNPMFIRDIVSVLTCVCNDCGKLLITEDIIKQKGWNLLPPNKRLAEIEEYCKGVDKCLSINTQIGKGKILPCNSNPVFVTEGLKEKGEITYKITEDIKEKEEITYKMTEDCDKKKTKNTSIKPMTISKVIDILDRISDSDSKLLGFSQGSHPKNLIMKGCLVIPTIARPPVYEGSIRREDKLTTMYVGIVKRVNSVNSGKKTSSDLYSIMKELIYGCENSSNSIGLKDFKSIIERVQGKEALIRGALMGKRGNYCARTVAGPDPSLEFGQIRIPKIWARTLTKRVTITKFNIESLQNLFDKGEVIYKICLNTGLKKSISNRTSYKLKLGQIIERWLQTDDRVIINRQPTLHRQSKMAYRVVLGKELTIGLHLSYTTPMNCDFDGDENNVWLPRNFEVEAEAEILLNVKNNIMSSEHNRPIMGLVMNSITSAYLLTKQNNKISEEIFNELCDFLPENKRFNLEDRLIKWGVPKNSGKAIFSAMLPSDFYYNQKGILIIDGVLIEGRLKKSSVGASHRSIIQDLHKKYGSSLTSDFFTYSFWILNKWITERGFSVGLLDMINLYLDNKNKKEVDKNIEVLNKELAGIYNQLETLSQKTKDKKEESLRQRKITNLSNITTGIGIKLANDALTPDNSISVMTEKGAGTKGAVANIGQMMGAVGQQFLYGERISQSINDKKRTLPTFEENDTNPEAYGFIPTSFFTGLNPESLFFLQAGGRPALLDTSLKTQDTGSMQHKMIKAFENVVISYDGSVRNTIGTLFTPIYNSGYDVGQMMMIENCYSNEFSSFVDIKTLCDELNIGNGWIPEDVNNEIIKRRNNIYPNKIYKEYNIKETPFEENFKIQYKYIYPITKFEESRIKGTRSIQLLNGANPIINIDSHMTDPLDIATKEYETGKLNIHVIRKLCDGTSYIIHPTKDNHRYD